MHSEILAENTEMPNDRVICLLERGAVKSGWSCIIFLQLIEQISFVFHQEEKFYSKFNDSEGMER